MSKICCLTFSLLLLMLFDFKFYSRLANSYLLILGLSIDTVWSSCKFQNRIFPSLSSCEPKNRKLLPYHLWFPLPLKCILALLLIHKVKSRTIMQLLCLLLTPPTKPLFACWSGESRHVLQTGPFLLLLSVLLWPIAQLSVLSWICTCVCENYS